MSSSAAPVRRSIFLALLGAALLCSLAGPSARSAVAAPWTPAVELAEPGTYNVDAVVKFDGAGDALAVWRHSGGSEFVQVAEKPAGGVWAAPVNLSSSPYPPETPQIAVDPAGDAVVVWGAYGGSRAGIWAAVRSAGGPWQPPVEISEPGFAASGARVAIDSTGAAVVVWERLTGNRFEPGSGEGVVQAARMTAAGVWGPPATLSLPSQESFSPDVAFDSGGSATVVWQRYDGSAGTIEAAETGPGGIWQSPIALSEPATNAIEAHVAADALGGLVAVWARYNGGWTIQSSDRPGAGPWSPPADVSTPGQTALSPQLAVAASGRAIAVWQTHVAQYIWMVQAASGLGGVWEAPVDISAASELDEPQVAVDPAGDAVASWVFNNGSPQVATKTANGPWQPPVFVPQYPGSHAKVAVAPSGNAIVVSQHDSFSNPEAGVQVTEHEAIRLAVAKTGTGAGAVSSAPAGIECGPTCSAQFEDESSATLSAVAAAGSEFTGWSGACTGTGPCTVAMSASRSVGANFKLLAPEPEPQPQPEPKPEPQPQPKPQPKPEVPVGIVAPATPPAPAAAPACNAVAATAGTFVPIPGPGQAVAGVRATVSVAAPSQLLVEPTLTYASGGQTHRLALATVALHAASGRNLRMALPAATRAALPLGTWVGLTLRIAVTPDSSPSCAPALSTRHVRLKVMRVLAAPQPGVGP